jgi:hypothetical protein
MEECGRYLETIKVYENKPADSIREHMDNDYMSRVCIIPMNPRIILFCNWQINHELQNSSLSFAGDVYSFGIIYYLPLQFFVMPYAAGNESHALLEFQSVLTI